MGDRKDSNAELLLSFAYGVKRNFFAALITTFLSIIASFLMPQVIRFTIDSVIGDVTPDLPAYAAAIFDYLGGRDSLRTNFIFCAVGVMICSLLAGLFNYSSRMSIAKATEGFSKKMRDKLFAHIQALPFQWHTDNLTGDIIQRCTSDVETIQQFVSRHLIEVVRTVILVAAAMTLMFSMNIRLAVVVLLTIPVIVLYSTVFFGRISKQFLKADEAEGALTVAVQENLTAVRVVRAFGRESYELDVFRKKLDDFTNAWINLGGTLGLYWGVGDAATVGQLLCVICFGAYFAAKGQMTLGELLAFISYTQTIAWPVRTLGRTLSELSKTGVSVKRIREILDAKLESDKPGVTKPSLDADIRFENVSFSYGDNSVLRGLNFEIKRGTTIGILGVTGSGKSTVTYLLNRLYELPEENGKITIGGVDIRDIDRAHLRKNIGLVLQEPFLFSKTIAENIAIADRAVDIDSVRAHAVTASIDDNIMEFTEGYETVVGERGVTLSGGQKQRIAIARTLKMGCPIMVFDDSMSAVDMETDERIRHGLREDTAGATVILISHRINTLMQADKIIVIENGTVSESGTHEELIAQDGLYRRVYKLQSDAAIDNPEGGDKLG